MTVVDIFDRISILGNAFEINNFKLYQLKILLAAIALSDHTYKPERALLFKIVAEKENCTYSDIRGICYAHVERTADVRRVEDQRITEVNVQNRPKSKAKIRK